MKLIDADFALGHLPDDLPYKSSVRRVLIQMPEAVVHCADCRYCGHVAVHNEWYCCMTNADLKQKELVHHFCGYGKARCKDGT